MDPILAFLGQTEIIFLVVLIFLLFGAAKIPDLARALGKAQGEFSRAKREFEKEARAKQAASTGAAVGGATEATAGTAPASDEDREALLARAQALGVPTEGRSLDEIQRDVESRGA